MEYLDKQSKLNDLLKIYNYKEINCCLNCTFCLNVGIDEDVYECVNDKMKLHDIGYYYPSVFNGICDLYKKE
jgi:hypothetical protein